MFIYLIRHGKDDETVQGGQLVGQGEQHLTEAEKKRGLVPMWVEIPFFADIVSKHEDYAPTNEEKRGSYLREYTAIGEYLNFVQNKNRLTGGSVCR